MSHLNIKKNIMLKIFTYLFVITVFSFKVYSIDTKAPQAIVIDFDTNEILFEKTQILK